MIQNPRVPGRAGEMAFFEQMAECREPYRRLAQCIEEIAQPTSVLDIGCGCGHVITYFAEKRIAYCPVFGVDGDVESRKWSEKPELIRIADLRVSTWFSVNFDLVICTETAEHIDEKFADVLVETVAHHTERMLVWSAAQPGQEGPGHVNLQFPEYWTAKLALYGLRVDEEKTATLRARMLETHAQHEYCASNFVVMVRT